MNKNFRMLIGIVLHPFKMLMYYARGGSMQYELLALKAKRRARNKEIDRSIYLSSLTSTPLYGCNQTAH